MLADFSRLEEITASTEAAGKNLLAACDGDIFPCDALAIAVLSRTLTLTRAFRVLMEAKSYAAAAPLVRLQLDSALRLNGIITRRDPHQTAAQVCRGISLRTLKHPGGGTMTDRFLQTLLEKRYVWVSNVYDLASGYIHLSEQHFLHLLMQAPKNSEGTREFTVSDEDAYVPEEHKASLVQTFETVTEGVLNVVARWIEVRASVTDRIQLKQSLSAV